jgi:hypothetical protein
MVMRAELVQVLLPVVPLVAVPVLQVPPLVHQPGQPAELVCYHLYPALLYITAAVAVAEAVTVAAGLAVRVVQVAAVSVELQGVAPLPAVQLIQVVEAGLPQIQ